MSIVLSWNEIAIRLLLTLAGGALIGINRGEHGRAAGLRTTILVCFAASVSMIQANLLLGTAGKSSDSFITLDLMRLPLGILSGMGFIGGGVILKRGNLLIGVTTAATLWFVTVMGLCFGGGQIGLGLTMLAIGLLVLYVLKWAEDRMAQDRRATLILSVQQNGPTEQVIRTRLQDAGIRVLSCAVTYVQTAHVRKMRCELQWRTPPADLQTPDVVKQLAELPGVDRLKWQM
jgi:putative Mg2+ transporter-C (MgtC) family protein